MLLSATRIETKWKKSVFNPILSLDSWGHRVNKVSSIFLYYLVIGVNIQVSITTQLRKFNELAIDLIKLYSVNAKSVNIAT